MSSRKPEPQAFDGPTYDTANLTFGDVNEGKIGEGKTAVKFRRIPILTEYPDGRHGDLLLTMEDLFSYGVQENVDPNTKKVNGYVLPLEMYSRPKPTDRQKKFVEVIRKIIKRCKQHVVNHSKELFDLDEEMSMSDSGLKSFDKILYIKDKNDQSRGPRMYAKFMTTKKNDGEIIIKTLFGDENGEKLDPKNMIAVRGNATIALQAHSIFLGSKTSLQFKLYQVAYTRSGEEMKSVLSFPGKPKSVLTKTKPEPKPESTNQEDEDLVETNVVVDDDQGSVKDSEDENDHPTGKKSSPSKKLVKRKTLPRRRVKAT